MSGSAPLLVPSQSRIVALDARPGAGPAAWPNKNAADTLDYWLDCNGLLRDLGGPTVVSLGNPFLQVAAGDDVLAGVGNPVVQLGMIMWMLSAGTIASAYQLMATVPVIGSPSRVYTKLITLTLTSVPLTGAPLPTIQDPDMSDAAEQGLRTTDETLQAGGTSAADCARLSAAVTLISGGTGGFGLPAGRENYEFRAINITTQPQNFYPVQGSHWISLGIDMPIVVPPQAESTGIQFPSGVCVAG